MPELIRGLFLSDLHMSDTDPKKTEAIDITPIFKYAADVLHPNLVILGGDLIDAKDMHGIEGFRPEDFKWSYYERDLNFMAKLLRDVKASCPDAHVVYLEGNHEERYTRLARKYPELFKGKFNFLQDIGAEDVKWIPYGTYKSYWKVGDCFFIHGNVYPDAHAKKYAQQFSPYKVWYGHLHDAQLYTQHVAGPNFPPRYAGTAGCLSKRGPEWKKGTGNRWVNGFADFMCFNNKTTIITPHFIENKKFYIGDKFYEAKGEGY